MKALLFVLISAGLLSAQIKPPVAGVIRDKAGALRPVLGVSGAFVVADPIATGVVSAAFSGTVGLAKTDTELLVFNSDAVVERHAAPEGPALFEFDQLGKPARAWFPQAQQVWRWTADGIVTESTPDIVDLQSPVRREETSLLVIRTGTQIDAPQGITEQMSASWMVVHAADGDYAVRIESGREVALRLPEVSE